MAFLETPSRILRRMEALEAQDSDLPSLPSLPAFDDSAFHSAPSSSTQSVPPNNLRIDEEDEDDIPYHSTPAPTSSHVTTRSTVRPTFSTSSSATRFANSMRASASTARKSQIALEQSFEISQILPPEHTSDSSSASIPDAHLPPKVVSEDAMLVHPDHSEALPLGGAMEHVNHPQPPSIILEEHPRLPSSKRYDYSVSLRSEPKASPINPHRNVSMRKPLMTRTRTPSLSRTTPSPTSISSNSTPRSSDSQAIDRMTSLAPEIVSTDFRGPQEHSTMGTEHDLSEVSQMELMEPLAAQDAVFEEDRSAHEHRDSSPEPTFSSDEQPQSSGSPGSRTPFPRAFSSSPAPTASFPLPVNREITTNFTVNASSMPSRAPPGAAQDLETPYNRRRSFLLSLVHSTARPRMTFPTPHPNNRIAPTPRIRTHPLSQAWTPSSAHPVSNPSSGSSLSPHDRLSFISTASSHDLTVHPRANASFDPVTGSKGVGRFNAIKLNTYLHGLNRRLQEENEMLVRRLRTHGEEVEMGKLVEELEHEGFKDVEDAVLQEIDTMRGDLERCEQEKDTVMAERDVLCAQLETMKRGNEDAIKELHFEQDERKKDKERWKSRMAEVESGIEGVIQELERRLEDAERAAKGKVEAEDESRRLQAKCAALHDEIKIANLRAEKAESALAGSSDLGAEIRQVNERAAAHRQEAYAANEKMNDVERRLRAAEQRGKDIRVSLENQLAEADAELRRSLESQQSAQAHALEIEEDFKAAEGQIDELEKQLVTARESAAQILSENRQLHARGDRLEENAARAAESARQIENALEESERKMISDGEELASLRTRISHLERELETRRERSKSSTWADPNVLSSPGPEIEHLETELDNAHREIAKLNYLLSDSPTRKAIEKAKNMRIELLEKEKDELSERVRELRSMMSLPRGTSEPTMTPRATPFRRRVPAFKSPITPGPPLKDYSWLHGNTPGPSTGPLIAQIQSLQQELNLANNSIDAKVDKLEEAGIDIVGLTEKLEDARSRIVTLEDEIGRLTRREERQLRRMERARCQECEGKVDLAKFMREVDQSSVDLSSTSFSNNPRTPPSKAVEVLKVALDNVNMELLTLRSQWESEKKQLVGEKAVLQNAASRLNMELGAAKNEVKQALDSRRQEDSRARTSVEIELSKVKAVVNDLEDALKSERSRLRALSTEQSRLGREKDEIFVQLQRAQSDMDDVKTQLEVLKHDNRELEAELRATATIDQRAGFLEAKVLENQGVIEQLREERESLAADQAGLQRHYMDASAHVNCLRQELATSKKSHDKRRHQLDLQVAEIERLRQELIHQENELERIELEKKEARADRSSVTKTVACLESDLRGVREDAEALGKDLKDLKKERDKLEAKHLDELGKADRVQKQLYAQVRISDEQLEVQRAKTNQAISDLKNHVCEPNPQNLEKLRTQHSNECKGLMVQIRYLKARFTRESLFRADLGYQKRYLLEILANFEKSEKQVLAAVARIGFPSQPQVVRKRRTLRAIAVAALFIAKARRASEDWREQSSTRSAVTAALQEVRRRRVAGSLGYIPPT